MKCRWCWAEIKLDADGHWRDVEKNLITCVEGDNEWFAHKPEYPDDDDDRWLDPNG